MNKNVFPIVEVKGNRLVSLSGNVGHLYQLLSPDLEQLSPEARESFYDGISKSLDSLSNDTYFKFYRLKGNSYLETNLDGEVYFPNIELKSEENPLDILFGENGLYSSIGMYDDYLSFNGQYTRVFSAFEFSEDEIDESFIPDDVDYVLTFKKVSKEKSVSKLEKIRTGHLSSFLKSKRDISSEGTYGQAEELLYDLMHGNESLFEMELFFLVSGHSLEELNQSSVVFQSEMMARGLKVYVEGQSLKKLKSGLTSLFNELIPGVLPKLGLRVHPNKTSHLKYLLPFGKSFLMEEGVRFHDFKGDEIFFNPFNKHIKNRNMLVTGTSGAGKSVFVNKLVHHLIKDHPTVILDKGGSFKRLTLFHEGANLEKGFNPMQFKDPLYLREIVLSVVDSHKFEKLERGKLLREIKKALLEVNTFEELINFLGQSFEGIELYFEEVKDYFIDETVDFTRILYVDVEKYPKGIIAPLIIFILEYFKNLPEREKILVFDECWSFLKDHTAYIDECFRTFRKSGAFPIAISQALKDFSVFDGEFGQAITNNSYFKIYFPQEVDASGELSSFDVENIRSLRFEKNVFSECYLKTPDNRIRKTIRNYLTPLELELFHTEAGGEDQLLKFVKNFGGYFNTTGSAIESFVRLKHGHDKENKDDFSFYGNFDESISEHSLHARQ